MTDATVEVQPGIFEQPLEGDELQAVNALVNQHKANAALTQQLALDASRLITTSQERLIKQSSSGFFKRFANKISGKTSQNQLQNQVDTLQMQRYAWHYLKQLQQQNLINAQSIAVIRNNLGTMNAYIIETRDFLEQAVDKINRRLVHVENHTSFNNWSLNIEANKRRFKSHPRNLLILHLTYDFMRSHLDIELTSRDVNYLVVTLEKLGVNCDEEVKLLDFIVELIEQIEITGIERYREMIELGFDGHSLDSHFIQKNISGIGFNALYFLSEQYDKIIDLIEDTELCRNDEDREKIIAKLFGNEFSGLATHYGIRDLIGEVIGGSALAIDIYKDLNGLNALPDAVEEHDETEPLSLTSSLPEIHTHTFFDTVTHEQARRDYVRLLALCVDGSAALNKPGLEFLALLAEKGDCPDACADVPGMADSSRKTQEYLPALRTLLSDEDKIYTWLVDAFFLLTLCEKKISNPQMAHILATLKPAQFKDNFPHLLVLVNESDETQVLEAAAKLAPQTRGWKNVIRYRSLTFDQHYTATGKKLRSASMAATTLNFDLTDVLSKASDHSFFMESFDDSFFSKVGSAVGATACSMGRSSALSSLNELRKKAYELISEHSTVLHQANGMITRLGMPKIEFSNVMSYSDYDLDNSASNDDWYDQFCRFEQQIDQSLTAFAEACSDADDQLDYFKAGDFHNSIVEVKRQKRAAAELAKQYEKLEKQSVVIDVDGRPHRFSIQWQDVENPPCDQEKINHIKTDGKVWLIVDNEGVCYRSEDREHWQPVRPDPSKDSVYVSKIEVVNNKWILVAGYDEGFFYSSDALNWRQAHFPELPSSYGYSKTEDVVYFNGQWLWRFTEREEYSFVEKGIIFDSTRTSSYNKPLIYCTDRLDAQWKPWEGTPSFSEGVEVECLRALPGVPSLLMFCKYNWMYTSAKKKNDAASFVSYYMPGKGWRTCTWEGKNDYYSNAIVTRLNNRLMCFYSDQYLTSDKGYEWKRQPDELYIGNCFHLKGVSIFPSGNDSQRIYLSEDGQVFKEFMLDDGRWKYFCANDQGALSVYELNSHETFLRAGRIICLPVE